MQVKDIILNEVSRKSVHLKYFIDEGKLMDSCLCCLLPELSLGSLLPLSYLWTHLHLLPTLPIWNMNLPYCSLVPQSWRLWVSGSLLLRKYMCPLGTHPNGLLQTHLISTFWCPPSINHSPWPWKLLSASTQGYNSNFLLSLECYFHLGTSSYIATSCISVFFFFFSMKPSIQPSPKCSTPFVLLLPISWGRLFSSVLLSD